MLMTMVAYLMMKWMMSHHFFLSFLCPPTSMKMQSLVKPGRKTSGKLYSMIPVVCTRTWDNITGHLFATQSHGEPYQRIYLIGISIFVGQENIGNSFLVAKVDFKHQTGCAVLTIRISWVVATKSGLEMREMLERKCLKYHNINQNH